MQQESVVFLSEMESDLFVTVTPVWKCNLSTYLKINPKPTKHLALTVEAPYPQKFLSHFQWPYPHVTQQNQMLYNPTPLVIEIIKLFFLQNLWREGDIKALQRVFWEIGSRQSPWLSHGCGRQWWRIVVDVSPHNKVRDITHALLGLSSPWVFDCGTADFIASLRQSRTAKDG